MRADAPLSSLRAKRSNPLAQKYGLPRFARKDEICSAENGFRSYKRSAQQGFTPLSRSAENGFTPLPRSAENGFTPLPRSAENGFTLIELLVALLIFGMLASAGVALLSFSVRAQAATTQRLSEVADERRISALLSADLAQVVPRISRDLDGSAEAAFDGGKGEMMMSYVRSGWSNSGGAQRSGLQRVEWRLVQGRLERITRPIVDGAASAKPVVMVDNVERATIRFRLKGEWRDDWNATDPRVLPRAVELTIKRSASAPIIRKFLVGTGY